RAPPRPPLFPYTTLFRSQQRLARRAPGRPEIHQYRTLSRCVAHQLIEGIRRDVEYAWLVHGAPDWLAWPLYRAGRWAYQVVAWYSETCLKSNGSPRSGQVCPLRVAILG